MAETSQAPKKPAQPSGGVQSFLLGGNQSTTPVAKPLTVNGFEQINPAQQAQPRQPTLTLPSGPVTSPSAPAPATPPPSFTNTSTTNPTIDGTVIPALLNRAQGGMGADTAIRLATGATRDAATGLMNEAGQDATRRGVAGSGAEGLERGKIAGQAQRAIAGQSADIAYRAEQDRNALYGQIAGTARASDDMQNEQRRLAIEQARLQQAGHEYSLNANLAQQRINQTRDMHILDLLNQPAFEDYGGLY